MSSIYEPVFLPVIGFVARVAMQCLHSLNAEQLSLNPPIARLAKLSADTAHNVP